MWAFALIIAGLGQTPDGGNSELDAYLREAAENRASLQAYYAEWQAALNRVTQANGLDDPTLSFGYFVMSDINEAKITLAQKLPWFGVRKARRDVAEANAESALRMFFAERDSVFFEVKQAYFEYAFLSQSIDVTRAQLEILTFMEEIVRSKYALGVALEADLLRIQIETSTVRDRLDRLNLIRPVHSARLAEAVGRSSTGAPLPWPMRRPLPAAAPTFEEIAPLIRAQNNDLAALEWQRASRERDIDLARKRGRPALSVGVDYMRRTDDGGEDFLMPMMSLSLPVWRKRVRADVTASRLRMEAVEHRQRHTELALEGEARQALFEMDDALRRYALYEESLLPNAHQSYESLETAYATGRADTAFIDLLVSVQQLLEFQLEQLRAERDLHLGRARLDRVIGSGADGHQ